MEINPLSDQKRHRVIKDLDKILNHSNTRSITSNRFKMNLKSQWDSTVDSWQNQGVKLNLLNPIAQQIDNEIKRGYDLTPRLSPKQLLQSFTPDIKSHNRSTSSERLNPIRISTTNLGEVQFTT